MRLWCQNSTGFSMRACVQSLEVRYSSSSSISCVEGRNGLKNALALSAASFDRTKSLSQSLSFKAVDCWGCSIFLSLYCCQRACRLSLAQSIYSGFEDQSRSITLISWTIPGRTHTIMHTSEQSSSATLLINIVLIKSMPTRSMPPAFKVTMPNGRSRRI